MTATLLNSEGLSPAQHVPDLSHHAVGPAPNVSCSEAKEPDACHEKPILAAIVLNQADTMVLSVVLDAQSMLWVVKIRAPKKSAFLVSEGDLHLWPGQSIQNQQHPQTSFHRRLRAGIGE